VAPEVIEGAEPAPSADIWSFGCTVIEMLTGRPPFFDCSPRAAMFKILTDDVDIPESASPLLKHFLSGCLQKEVDLRKSASDLMIHPWMSPKNRFYELLQAQIGSNPPVAVAAATTLCLFWRLIHKKLDKSVPVSMSLWRALESTKASVNLANISRSYAGPASERHATMLSEFGQSLDELCARAMTWFAGKEPDCIVHMLPERANSKRWTKSRLTKFNSSELIYLLVCLIFGASGSPWPSALYDMNKGQEGAKAKLEAELFHEAACVEVETVLSEQTFLRNFTFNPFLAEFVTDIRCIVLTTQDQGN
jgi:serine/threonine protein kinase